MLYKQFANIIGDMDKDFVERFDYWLATLAVNNQKNITASVVSTRLSVDYILADKILRYAEKEGILEKYYLVKCPECDYTLEIIMQDEIQGILGQNQYCDECEEDVLITTDDIYIAYKVILQADIDGNELKKLIDEKLGEERGTDTNFIKADSLSECKADLYGAYYNLGESAYNRLKSLRNCLDLEFENTTEQGNALETLVLELFRNIKNVSATNKIKTNINQFDCTVLFGVNTVYLSVFSYLSPYFIIECKNEPQKKPNNTYAHKLLGIMEKNEAQIGIIFARKKATSTCKMIARESYLKNSNSNHQKILLTFSDEDLEYLIERKANLLHYLEYKILEITTDTKIATYEMFLEND